MGILSSAANSAPSPRRGERRRNRHGSVIEVNLSDDEAFLYVGLLA
jgi:hypothetical protein